jgi:invasion protein IalB
MRILRSASRILLVLAAMALASPAPAQDAAAPAAPAAPAANQPVKISAGNDNPQPWAVSCNSQPGSDAMVCTMTQALLERQSGRRVVSATIFRARPDAAAQMRLNLPHGILLQEGVDVSVDFAPPAKAPITVADQNGSYATVELSSNLIVALQGGAFLNLGVKAANGEPVEFQLSLKGFTAAFAKL